MEHMTTEMKDIAQKTQTETVSMKIITLVTLFFLPGTFISVCYLALRVSFSFRPLITDKNATDCGACQLQSIAQTSRNSTAKLTNPLTDAYEYKHFPEQGYRKPRT